MSEAAIGYGAEFQRGDGADPEVFAHMGEVPDVVTPKRSAEAKEATHSQSPGGYLEFIKGMRSLEAFSLELHFKPGGATMADIRADFEADGPRNFRAVAPSGHYVGFSALVVGYEIGTPTKEKMVVTVDFQPTGAPDDGGGV